MLEKVIDYFIQITKIPHCSKKSGELLEFLKEFGIKRGYSIEIDSYGNLLLKRGNPKLALQAHYDMVCIGKAPNIETYIKDGWLYAKESSLGADNGIAIAIMMYLMDMQRELEFLFTADEEIGLIGASNLEFKFNSRYILNIDFEDAGEVCIGCAGGADILASKRVENSISFKYNYIVSVTGLQGGHSGVDIDKNIPNAIKVLAEFLKDRDIKIGSFSGGERINSIPTSATATISSLDTLEGNGLVKVEPIDNLDEVYNSRDFIDLLNEFKHGVDSFNSDLNIADRSINLAIVNFKSGDISIESSARAMSKDGLDEICSKNIELFKRYGFSVREADKYPAWKPEINKFTEKVYSSMERVFGRAKYSAIHAGLECGVLSKKYPNIKFASIGPTIKYPHSINEKVELKSIESIFNVILDLLKYKDFI